MQHSASKYDERRQQSLSRQSWTDIVSTDHGYSRDNKASCSVRVFPCVCRTRTSTSFWQNVRACNATWLSVTHEASLGNQKYGVHGRKEAPQELPYRAIHRRHCRCVHVDCAQALVEQGSTHVRRHKRRRHQSAGKLTVCEGACDLGPSCIRRDDFLEIVATHAVAVLHLLDRRWNQIRVMHRVILGVPSIAGCH